MSEDPNLTENESPLTPALQVDLVNYHLFI